MMDAVRIATFLVVLVFLLGGCNRSDYRVLHQGSWGGRVPRPEGPVLLVVRTPKGEYPLDERALRRLTWVELTTVFHPEEKKGTVGVFQGVLLEDLLAEFGYPNPDRIRFMALDGYEIAVRWRRIAPYRPMLALYRDGRPLPERYGPVRVIFPYHRLRPDPVAYNSYWVWKLHRLEILP